MKQTRISLAAAPERCYHDNSIVKEQEKAFMNYQNYGGSVLLGTSKVVVKGHGSSKPVAFEKCIEQAYKMLMHERWHSKLTNHIAPLNTFQGVEVLNERERTQVEVFYTCYRKRNLLFQKALQPAAGCDDVQPRYFFKEITQQPNSLWNLLDFVNEKKHPLVWVGHNVIF